MLPIFFFTGVKGVYFFSSYSFLVVGLLIVFKNDQEDKVINIVLNVVFTERNNLNLFSEQNNVFSLISLLKGSLTKGLIVISR